MTLRARLVSVLLFLGLSMVIPLGFSLVDLWGLESELVRLEKDVGQLTHETARPAADARLVDRTLEALTEVVARARRVPVGQGEPDQLRRSMERLEACWAGLVKPSPEALRALPGAAELLGLPPGDEEAWRGAAEQVGALGGAGWEESPAALTPEVGRLLEAPDEKTVVMVYKQLKQVAVQLRRRLLAAAEASARREPADQEAEALRRAQVRGRGRVVLEVVVDTKRREITRIGFLVCVGGVLALLFARVLWRDLLGPLDRLRVSINNMAMSGTPTPVNTDGPREVRDLLQAYNRLIDSLATEQAGSSSVSKPCSKCNTRVDEGDKYCRSCGFPC